MAATHNNLMQARQERDEAQQRFQITFDANPAPSMIVRLSDAEIVVTNPSLSEVSGLNDNEMTGYSVRDLKLFTHPDDFERTLALLRQGGSTVKETLVMSSRTQGERIVLVSAAPIELEVGSCGIFTFADVTELKQSQELFSQTFQLAPIPATLTDTETRFTEVNEAFIALMGYTREEVIGRSSNELQMWPSREDYRRTTDALKKHGQYHNLELNVRTKEGQTLHVLGSAKLLTVADKRVLLHIFYDMTERKRTEEQMHLAVQSIMTDTSWFTRELMARLLHIRVGGKPEGYKPIDLSPREKEVLSRMALGRDNERIAEDLGVRVQTVRNYITTIYSKLDVHSRTEAVIWAREHGMLGS